MISAVAIAQAEKQLELELLLIRHFLTHPQAREVRDAFIEKQTKTYEKGLDAYLSTKTDRDVLDDMAAPAIKSSHRRWLTANLHQIKEFSENRLNQMELILRYAIFEGSFLKIVGNIIWEYPDLRRNPIYARMKLRGIKKSLTSGSLEERIAWTKAAIDAIDRLPFARFENDDDQDSTPCVWEFLGDCLGLSFGQEQHCKELERVRRIRNHIVHRSHALVIPDERMAAVIVHLSNFPTLFVNVASEKYPKACTQEPPEEGDDGTPGYSDLDSIL